MRGIRLVIVVAAALAVIGIASFLYLTRDVAAPSQPIAASVATLAPEAGGGAVVFRISQAESQAEYNIYELLNGADKTVIGVTNQVAGEIALNLNDLTQTEVGEIRINARTFATDNGRRDSAVARFVLKSEADANEFIVFQPTALTGLPSSAAIGETVSFQMTGDLTVAGVTQSVAFDVTATLESESRLTGQAETVIQRSAFNLTIPNVPSVANVGEDVTLKLVFVAVV
jgi:polyisoprenoid-binding protein YceI